MRCGLLLLVPRGAPRARGRAPDFAQRGGQGHRGAGLDPTRPGPGSGAAHGGARDPHRSSRGTTAAAHRANRGSRVRAAPDLGPDRPACRGSRRAAAWGKSDRGPSGASAERGGRGRARRRPPSARCRRRSSPRMRPRSRATSSAPSRRTRSPASRRLPRRRPGSRPKAPTPTISRLSTCSRPAIGRRPSRHSPASSSPIRTTRGSRPPPTGLARPICSAKTFRPRPRCSPATTALTARQLHARRTICSSWAWRWPRWATERACQTFAELVKRHPKAPGADHAGGHP